MIEIEIAVAKPGVELSLPAEGESLPVIRQAVRSVGEAVGVGDDRLEDAQLAISEACVNVVEHAYGPGTGRIEVVLDPRASQLAVSVCDRGRGMPVEPRERKRGRGFGLAMIEEIAAEMDIRAGKRGGTDVLMWFDTGPLHLNGAALPAAATVERIARRIVAVIGAQTNLPIDRLVESLLAVELAARHAPRYLLGERIQLSLERLEVGFDLWLGPLVPDGARALVRASDVPAIGPVIERLADRIGVEGPRTDADGERLSLRVAGPSAGTG